MRYVSFYASEVGYGGAYLRIWRDEAWVVYVEDGWLRRLVHVQTFNMV